MEHGAELDVANCIEVELELGRNGDREPDDLFGVAPGACILGLERVRERRERLAVEALSALLVLEAGQEGAQLCGRDLGQVPLQAGKDTGSRVVDLDQAPTASFDHDRNEQDRLHLHLAEHEELGRVGAGIVGGDGAELARLQD